MDPVGGPITLSPEDGARWYTRWIEPGWPDRAYWLVTSGGRPVGEISFRGFDTSERRAMLDVKVAAWERGHGYARAAVKALLRFFFEDLAGVQMDDDVALNNPGGQSFILSMGFTRDSTAKDVCRLFLTREQLKAGQSA
jgi:RimJ/RimL family protein N-acetyltransferase